MCSRQINPIKFFLHHFALENLTTLHLIFQERTCYLNTQIIKNLRAIKLFSSKQTRQILEICMSSHTIINYCSSRLVFLQRGFSKRRRRRQLGMSLFPTTTQLPRNINENCSEAGDPSPNDPNYLHLCKVCSSQRVLEDNFYPHLLNEVYCEQSENGCLGSGNGKCAKTMFHVHILKRREDICRLCIKDQEPLIMNEWEIHNEAISVGCECMLNKNSDYRNSWFNSNPTTSYNERFVGKR